MGLVRKGPFNHESIDKMPNDEAKAFEEIRARIRGESDDKTRWQEIAERYIYDGTQYTPQEVIDWFMAASFEDIKKVAKALSTDWKTIANDVQWMVNALKRFEDDSEPVVSDLKARVVGSQIMAPFGAEPDIVVNRDVSRLLFDFSLLLSCIKKTKNLNVLDFAGGNGWVSEYLNRAGFDVSAFDINPGIVHCIEERIQADARVEPNRLHTAVCDGHNLDIYKDGYFGNIVCFDSLHHMHDFEAAFKEMFRVLEPGGRASFAEPGAKHAESEETKQFIQRYKANDPNWLEKNVVLDEINETICKIGFHPLRIKPFLIPSMVDYSFYEWKKFNRNYRGQKDYISLLLAFNYNNRVVFYIDKPKR